MRKFLSTTRESSYRTLRRKRKTWLATAVVLLAIGWSLPKLWFSVSTAIMYPFQAVAVWLEKSDNTFPAYLRSKVALTQEVEDLRKQLTAESGNQLTIKYLQAENTELRSLAKIEQIEGRIVARVIARPGDLAYDLLQIDQGKKHGISEGALVFSNLNNVIGVVVSAADDFSFVELFTTAGFELPAYIVGLNMFSVMEGRGGGVARVKLPQGVVLEKGQLVILPSVASGGFGQIEWIENHPTQPEQYGYVVPPIPLNNLFYVSVTRQPSVTKTVVEIKEEVISSIKKQWQLDNTTVDEINFLIQEDLAKDEEEVLNEDSSSRPNLPVVEIPEPDQTLDLDNVQPNEE